MGLLTERPQDLLGIAKGSAILPSIQEKLGKIPGNTTQSLIEAMNPSPEIIQTIELAITEEPANIIRDGGVLKEGYHAELDRLRSLSQDSHQFF